MRVKMPIVTYNENGVKNGRIIKKIAVGMALVFGAGMGILSVLNVEYNTRFINQVFVVGVLSSIGLIYFSITKIGYHNSKYTKIGNLTIGVDGTTIELDSDIKELEADAYFVAFSNEGFEGENKSQPLVDAGYLLFNSGINKIYFSNFYDDFSYNVLVSNQQQVDVLNRIISEINKNLK